MDPVTAHMIISLVVAYYVTRATWDAARDQAKEEIKRAREAIRDDLQGRGRAWARRLNDRLADGRRGGPSTALWWGWAAMRTARGLRRAVRRDPRDAERKPHAVRGTTGPFQRIFDAALRGARFAREEARRQRAAGTPPTREPAGVCRRCGAVVAVKSLVWALTRFGRQERMCARCRAAVDTERAADEKSSAESSGPGPDVHDADVVGDRGRAIEPAAQPAVLVTVERRPQPAPAPVPAASTIAASPASKTLGPAPAAAKKAIEGAPPVSTSNGSVVPYRPASSVARRPTGGNGGESYTHGGWNAATNDIRARLDQIPAALEQMLALLNAADAGRTQVAGVLQIREQYVNFMGLVEAMLVDVNRIADPVVNAVTDAGGPEEIAGIPYMADF